METSDVYALLREFGPHQRAWLASKRHPLSAVKRAWQLLCESGVFMVKAHGNGAALALPEGIAVDDAIAALTCGWGNSFITRTVRNSGRRTPTGHSPPQMR